MEGETNGAIVLESTEHIPIAQLNPELAEASTRAIKAVVTLTWPYSSATGSVAFLLSEPDYRLRRTRGQVRVRFSGSSAKAIAASGIASGDEVIICLDGVEWVSDDATIVTPGRGIEHELRFTERLLLQFKQEDSEEIKKIDLDHPPPEEPAPARIPTPEPEQSTLPANTPYENGPIIGLNMGEEWSSPAFLKRARTSYGSLFEIDPFAEEDGSVAGKGRKRTRLSSIWKYSSRSQTPEAEQPEVESMGTSPGPAPKPAPTMTDEGCQTVDFANDDATEDVAQALADLSRQATNAGGAAYPASNGFAPFGQPQLFVPFSAHHASEPELPIIRTEVFTQQIEEDDNEPSIPKSPRLQPIPSDSMTFVSPLLTTKSNIFSRHNGDMQMDKAQAMPGYEAAILANGSDAAESITQPHVYGNDSAIIHMNGADLEEDIYSASPAGHREQPESDFSGFQEPIDEEPAIFDSHLASENQYGHWQSAGAQLSNAASPSRTEIFKEGTHGDRSHEGEELHHGDEEPLGPGVEIPHSAYPELEDGLLGQVTSGWGASSVSYPELPGSGDHAAPYAHPPARSTVISRSQSVQSAVVDLTESDDEADPKAYLQHSGEEYDESAEGRSDEDNLDEWRQEEFNDGQLEDVLDGKFEKDEFDGPQVAARREYQDGAEDSEADGEGDFEDEPQQLHSKMPSAFGSDMNDEDRMEEFYEDEEGSYDEEEGSCDQEEEDYAERPNPQIRQQPEVIDLLSSDDEDENEAPPRAPVQTANSRISSPNRSHISEDNDMDIDGESESERGEENVLPYSERSEIKTMIPGQEVQYSSSMSEEVEDRGEEENVVFEDESPEDGLPPGTLTLNGESESENDGSEELDSELEPQPDEGQEEDDVFEQPPARIHVSDKHHEEDAVSQPPFTDFGKETSDDGNEGIEESHSEVDANSVEDDKSNGIKQIHEPQETERIEMEINSPFKAVEVEKSLPITAPQRSSLFSRVFSLDGANDEPRFGSSYRSMSRDEGVLPSSALLLKVFSEVADEPSNAQLPTPQDTQISKKTVPLENFFSSVPGIQQPASNSADDMVKDGFDESPTIQNQDSQLEFSIPAARSSPVAETQMSTETTTVEVTVETTEIGDYDVEIRTETVTRTSEVSQISDNTPDETYEREESLNPVQEDEEPNEIENESEREMEETTVLMESTSKVSIEESQPQTTRDRLRSYDGADDARSQTQSEHADDVTEVPEAQVEGPRRSTRQTNPTLQSTVGANQIVRPVTPKKSSAGPSKESLRSVSPPKTISRSTNQKENVRPVTPAKSREVPSSMVSDDEQSPLVLKDNRATPKGHDASLEFALEASDASSPPQHNLRKLPVADLKLRLTRALRTDFSEFTGLKVLRFHLTQKLDFLAVATTTPPEPQRAKNGPRQYQITFNITDPSIAPSGVTEVQVFRPYKDALPIVEAGDGILLRNFLVMSVQSKGSGPAFALRSTQEDASSWAVFKDDNEVEVRGPPVEYGDGEKNHVLQLKTWYANLDNVAQAKITRANGDKGTAGNAARRKA